MDLGKLLDFVNNLGLTKPIYGYTEHYHNGEISHYTRNLSFAVDNTNWYIRIFHRQQTTTISLYTENHKIDIFWKNWDDFLTDLENRNLDCAGVNGFKTTKTTKTIETIEIEPSKIDDLIYLIVALRDPIALIIGSIVAYYCRS